MSEPSHSAAERQPDGTLPLVVQVGFAGARELPDDRDAILDHLRQKLRDVPKELGLLDRHFLCGISQVAAGADMLFTQACAAEGLIQRIFLPQARENYLRAMGSHGRPDFSESEQEEARRLLQSEHIIQERVVSDSPNRYERFEDANLEIVADSDVVICLITEETEGKPGGTKDLLERARNRGKPVLRIDITEESGQLRFRDQWLHQSPTSPFAPPSAPPPIDGIEIPGYRPGAPPPEEIYCSSVKSHASAQAQHRQAWFINLAWIIIGTHILATILASLAMGVDKKAVTLMQILLAAELIFLLGGYIVHRWLHASRAVENWARGRLIAEMTRSVGAVRPLHVQLGHLFALPMPSELRSLAATLNVIHLRETKLEPVDDWQAAKAHYAKNRIENQRTYFEEKEVTAKTRLKLARLFFLTFSILAMIATFTKLMVVCDFLHLPAQSKDDAKALLGVLAIALPVLAVAALSLAAAFDLEARLHTFREQRDFLAIQRARCREAGSKREFASLVLETESRLLGETVNWYARRSFTGIA